MKVSTISIDLAKNVFQLLGMDKHAKQVFSKRLNRTQLSEFMSQQPVCDVVFEACYSSHYWGRKFLAMGHNVKLIPAQHVTPFVRGSKNDKNDAMAIYEANFRPNIRFVPIKTEAQQEILMLHRVRERLVKQRTACTNQIRGVLVDFGICFPQGHSAFERAMWDIINDESQRPIIKLMANDFWDEYQTVSTRLDRINRLIKQLVEQDPNGKILLSIPGVGPIIASAFAAAIGAGQAFNSAKELAVWLGLTPQQFASGNKSINGSITKRGDGYLRKQLIHGARTVVSHASKKNDDLNQWITQLRNRKSICTTVVATAHRLARLMWILLHKQVPYAPQYGAYQGISHEAN
ncbi:transposase IS116/IS110/IS902 [Shewanella denitrificans OS217]|uniref:Transposase IS116/IS110/IS902 n=2 Tax=Shewanella TaxID=22 RepID=Q12IY9_SHEDO|nr:IS110-like element ISSde11 family transposase [Shewanella denitrificans]ABE53496.1 transposase IS116/IS110/IS902 [Shewanella denitrificans OS217]ABE56587.1 transposase IS116/IS110/IS902 [Shewanella denitrificans OS217]